MTVRAKNTITAPEKSLKTLQQGVGGALHLTEKEKIDLLKRLDSSSVLKPGTIRELYHLLLFLQAYPESKSLFNACRKSSASLAQRIQNLSSPQKKILEQSGLPHTRMLGIYSYSIVHWLLNQKSEHVSLDHLENGAFHPLPALELQLEELEFELTGRNDLKAMKWLEQSFGTTNKTELLKRLVGHFGSLKCSEAEKDKVFETLRICVALTCRPEPLKFVRRDSVFYHTEGRLKRFNEADVMNASLPPRRQLSRSETTHLISNARKTLLCLNRETDPISLCTPDGVEYYELERGFGLAFFSKSPKRRLPLESYIGFMMYKNGFPVSYGGAWLFGKRSLLGINIFESFRGGESAFLFAQLIRGYRQRFSPAFLEVESYQFGNGNPDGIKSGAFWFYYRFGFRPIDPKLFRLAESEFKKIQKNKAYRTPASTLRQLAESNVVLNFGGSEKFLHPSRVSHYITEQINQRFNGNRARFRNWALKKVKSELGLEISELNASEKTGVLKLIPFVSLCLKTNQMSASEKNNVLHWIVQKGRSEFRYAELCSQMAFELYAESEDLFDSY